MANLVVHFEIHASEPQKLVDFYSGLLGWTFDRYGETPYWVINTGEGAIGNVAGTAGHGINGGLVERRGPKPEVGASVNGCNIVVGVNDVDGTMMRRHRAWRHGSSAAAGLAGRRPRSATFSIRTTTSSASSRRSCPTARSGWAAAPSLDDTWTSSTGCLTRIRRSAGR